MQREASGGRVRAVLLDVDGTLYRQGPLRRRMAAELLAFTARRLAAGLRTARILRTFRREREALRGLAPQSGSCEQLQYDRPAALLGVRPHEVRRAVAEWMLERPLRHLRPCLAPGVVPFLDVCRERGVRVGAFSDYPTHEKLAALGLLRYFGLELCSTSPEVNAFKPSPAGVLGACRAWAISPEEILVVGDRDDVDGGAARAAGARFALVGGSARDFAAVLVAAGLGGEC